MAHGHEDYGVAAPIKTIYTLQDVAELAARLGSIDTFDRRGNVLFMETFQGSLAKLQTGTSGSNGSISISNQRARFGDFSCKMVTGDATNNKAFIIAYLPYMILSKVGFEVSWCPQLWIRDIELRLYFYTGATYKEFSVRWHAATDEWQYYDSNGDWIALSPTHLLARDVYTFNFTKLVVNLDTQEYVRLICNNLSWDLSGISPWGDVSSDAPIILCETTIYTRDDYSCTVYLGSMIVTQNEP
jgi:hypothetical protein